MPPVGFEPTISAGEGPKNYALGRDLHLRPQTYALGRDLHLRPQTYALDRAATGIGSYI